MYNMKYRLVKEQDNKAKNFQMERIEAFNRLENKLDELKKLLRQGKIETIKYYRENPDSFGVVIGTDLIAENVNLNPDNFSELEKHCIEKEIKLIIVGPEKPLVNGIVDHFKGKSIKVFGPDKISSKLEGSKIFTKKICQ